MLNKRTFAVFALCAGLVCPAFARDLKVLSIGNSYSVSVGTTLASVVESFPEHGLELTSAYLPGCPLNSHVKNIKAAQEDPKAGQYMVRFWRVAAGKSIPRQEFSSNLIDLLKKDRYDVVTIQQASAKSWNWETYEPYAGELIAFIRQHQPDAEIVIQQTWSYRMDAPSLKKFGFDQNEMYDRLSDAYRKLAEKYKFRVIPVGAAVQLFRKYTHVQYQPTVKTDFKYPYLPSWEGDAVGIAYWYDDNKKMKNDPYHLNEKGMYIQACLWFSLLYGEPVDKITWVRKDLSQDYALLCRRCAKEALESYQQVAGKNEKK